MFITEITAEDLLTEKVETRKIYLNLTKAELTKKETGKDPLGKRLRDLSDDEKVQVALPLVEEIISMAYGEVRDGRFVKDAEATKAFIASEFYSELVVKMLEDTPFMLKLMEGILPKDIREAFQKEQAQSPLPFVDPINALDVTDGLLQKQDPTSGEDSQESQGV